MPYDRQTYAAFLTSSEGVSEGETNDFLDILELAIAESPAEAQPMIDVIENEIGAAHQRKELEALQKERDSLERLLGQFAGLDPQSVTHSQLTLLQKLAGKAAGVRA